MGEYHTLDLFRLNTFSTAKKEVIQSPNNRQPTVMQCSAIARRKPAFIVGYELQIEGIYVTGFFYPVVPKGQARIRTQMSAAHTPEQIERAVEAFTRIAKQLGVIA